MILYGFCSQKIFLERVVGFRPHGVSQRMNLWCNILVSLLTVKWPSSESAVTRRISKWGVTCTTSHIVNTTIGKNLRIHFLIYSFFQNNYESINEVHYVLIFFLFLISLELCTILYFCLGYFQCGRHCRDRPTRSSTKS